MREFKKWKDDNCVKHCNLCHIGVCGDCRGIGTKEDTWRAALEWVLKSQNLHLKTMLIQEIKKELEKDQWCEECRKKIENAKNLDVISICKTCAKRNL